MGLSASLRQDLNDRLIACVTPQVVSNSFRLVTSNQRSPKTGDFVASKFYGKVPRPFFPPPQRKTEKSGLATNPVCDCFG